MRILQPCFMIGRSTRMQIWMAKCFTVFSSAILTYWSVCRTFDLAFEATAKLDGIQSSHERFFSPVCERIDPTIPKDFLYLSVRTSPRNRPSRLKGSLQTWIKDSTQFRTSLGKEMINKVGVVLCQSSVLT